jgi:hypothetical protein
VIECPSDHIRVDPNVQTAEVDLVRRSKVIEMKRLAPSSLDPVPDMGVIEVRRRHVLSTFVEDKVWEPGDLHLVH